MGRWGVLAWVRGPHLCGLAWPGMGPGRPARRPAASPTPSTCPEATLMAEQQDRVPAETGVTLVGGPSFHVRLGGRG